jgi:hypothetical protein
MAIHRLLPLHLSFFMQVEGERLLLVATHKRAAALNEISRLKTAGEKILSNIQH